MHSQPPAPVSDALALMLRSDCGGEQGRLDGLASFGDPRRLGRAIENESQRH